MFKYALLITLVFSGITSFASGIDGAYHTKAEDLGNGETIPEMLQIFESGIYTIYSVHNGAVLVDQVNYQVSGSNVKALASEKSSTTTHNCNGLVVVTEEESGEYQAQFKKTAAGLTLLFQGDSVTFPTATQAKVNEIKSLPSCKKID